MPKKQYSVAKNTEEGKRELVCIMCPNGCLMKIGYEGSELKTCTGNMCHKGLDYARNEITDPKRNFASLVKVIGGDMPLVSVRLSAVIPKDRIFDVEKEIWKTEVKAPVHRGQCIIHDILGLGADVIATKDILKE